MISETILKSHCVHHGIKTQVSCRDTSAHQTTELSTECLQVASLQGLGLLTNSARILYQLSFTNFAVQIVLHTRGVHIGR